MKIDRLIAIIMVLLERKKISASKLAEMFEVTPRTIYRDIETISMAGIPIVTYPGINGGMGIIEQYKIDKKLFTTADITTLLMGLGSISSTLSSQEIVNTMAKVKGLVPAGQFKDIELKSNQISIDLTPWAGNRNFKPNLENIKKAMIDNRYLSFMYSGRVGKKSIRKVEAYQLVLKEANWYLHAYCTTRKDFRIFKLSRISELKILDEIFIPREFNPISLNVPDDIQKRIITIRLEVDESLRDRMVEICGEENIEPYTNNKFIANFPFLESDSGYDFLLSFGDKCKCLEPANVRAEVIRRIKNLAAVYF